MAGSKALWESILEEIQRNVRAQQFETWFRNVNLENLSDEALTLRVPNNFYQEWLRRHYVGTIQEALFSVTGQNRAVDFVVQPQPASAHPLPAGPPPPHADSAPPPAAHTAPATTRERRLYYPADWTARLNRRYTFEHFVVGPANALAHAAALAIIQNSAQAYNPLFIHGGVGLGKTHLVQAITHHMLGKQEALRILYISCESFMNHFILSVQHNEREKFHQLYRSLDILLIDDIHFLCRGTREMTQEEFFHTFNCLYNAGKQIVLSSDTPPQELTKLEDRLVSRFKWGLVARVDPPTFETRVAILRRKAQFRGRPMPDPVIHFIAEHIDTNIRDLEGAVTKIIGFASVVNKPIDLRVAEDALRDLVEQATLRITMDDIIRTITNEFHVKLSDLQSKKRSKSLTHPRQIAMYLARELTEHSLAEIGGYFGGRDHTTVMHACDKIGRLVHQTPQTAAYIERLTHRLRRKR